MTPTEQRIRIVVGDLVVSNAVLSSQLDEARARIAVLENEKLIDQTSDKSATPAG